MGGWGYLLHVTENMQRAKCQIQLLTNINSWIEFFEDFNYELEVVAMVTMDDFVRNTRVLAVVKTGWSIRKDGSTP